MSDVARVLATYFCAALLIGVGGGFCAGAVHGRSISQRHAALVGDSLEASRDTTRRLTLAVGVLADGTQVVQRRSVQQTQRADSLDRALKLERRMKADVRLEAENLRKLAESAEAVIEEDSVRYARFDIRNDGPTDSIIVDVHVPPAPKKALIDLTIGFKPVPLGFRVSCAAPDPLNQRLRPTHLTVTAPTFLRVSTENVEQDPEVCNPSPPAVTLGAWITDRRTLTVAAVLGLFSLIR